LPSQLPAPNLYLGPKASSDSPSIPPMILYSFGGHDIMERKLFLKNAIAKFDVEICFIDMYLKRRKGDKDKQNY